jgi:hypothetical protein
VLGVLSNRASWVQSCGGVRYLGANSSKRLTCMLALKYKPNLHQTLCPLPYMIQPCLFVTPACFHAVENSKTFEELAVEGAIEVDRW